MSTFMKIGNFFIRLILSSPLHGLMSKNTLVIEFTGRRSGKRYSTPVNYTQEGKVIRISSRRERVWWRNLKDHPKVNVNLRGETVSGNAVVLEEIEAAAEGLNNFLRPAPQLARYYQIKVNEDGSFDPLDLEAAAINTVVIEISLDQRPA